MFKLACFTDEISQDLSHALSVCKEFGLDGIELRSAWGKGPHENDTGDVAKIKGLIEESGLEVACIASPFFKCDLGDESAYKDHLGILRRSIDLGRQLGTNVIRGFTFWRTADPDDGLYDEIIKWFAEPVKILDSEGAVLGIENEAACHIGSAQELRVFLDRLGADRVKGIWDPSNQVYMPDEVPMPVPGGYELIKDDIVHVHMKDSKRLPGGDRTHVPVGDGEVDWPQQFALLKKDNYQGYCSLETHWRPSDELTEELMNQPGGEKYTEGAEAGSRVCLQNIQGMLRDLA
ncbi:MAG: TIM barrel protein [Armatimonadia bacterium]|nr:TIM barrel protein [Armatimonadia bacterium]